MQYKTITLQLLRNHPDVHNALRAAGTLHWTLDQYARELKAAHERWAEACLIAWPAIDPIQARSQALELAIQEMTDLRLTQLAEVSIAQPHRGG